MYIETERLIIRPFTIDDLPEFEKLLHIEELPGWGMQLHRSREFLEWYISNFEKRDICHSVMCFGVFEKITGRVLGAAEAGEHDDLHEPEIFYSMLKDERCKGYATEACRAVTGWMLENFDIPYIIGTVDTDNMPSRRVIEKCGYEFIEERHLLVHVTGDSYDFRYYRKYR